MNIERLAEVATSNKNNSINLQKLFAQSKDVSDQIELQRLRAQSKLLEERKKTYNLLAETKKEQDNKDNLLGKVLGTLGLGGLAKGLRGIRKPPGGGGGGGYGVLSRAPRPGGPRIGRGVVGLNLLFGGIDFLQRRSSGQTNLQAGVGAGAGVAGGIGGAYLGGQIGAAIGTVIAPGVGTLIGGGIGSLIGGGVGSYAAGGLADRATGVTSGDAEVNRRVREEEKRTSFLIAKTPFSYALDTFNRALDKLSLFRGGICACAGMSPLSPAYVKRGQPKNKLVMAYQLGYNKGLGEGRKQGGVAGFVVGVAVVGGVMFLTRGKGGPILQRIGTAAEIFETIPRVTKTPEITPRTPIDPGKVRVLPKEDLPAAKPEVDTSVQRIMRSVFGEEPASPHTPRIPRNPKTGKPVRVKMVKEEVDAPEAKYFVRRSASEAEKQTPEEFFQKGEMTGSKKRDSELKRVRETLSPEEVSPTGPQSSLGGQNIIALAEPNTTIVPVPVGGGTQFIGSGGASPYQAAAKYAQMMSQNTV